MVNFPIYIGILLPLFLCCSRLADHFDFLQPEKLIRRALAVNAAIHLYISQEGRIGLILLGTRSLLAHSRNRRYDLRSKSSPPISALSFHLWRVLERYIPEKLSRKAKYFLLRYAHQPSIGKHLHLLQPALGSERTPA